MRLVVLEAGGLSVTNWFRDRLIVVSGTSATISLQDMVQMVNEHSHANDFLYDWQNRLVFECMIRQ